MKYYIIVYQSCCHSCCLSNAHACICAFVLCVMSVKLFQAWWLNMVFCFVFSFFKGWPSCLLGSKHSTLTQKWQQKANQAEWLVTIASRAGISPPQWAEKKRASSKGLLWPRSKAAPEILHLASQGQFLFKPVLWSHSLNGHQAVQRLFSLTFPLL